MGQNAKKAENGIKSIVQITVFTEIERFFLFILFMSTVLCSMYFSAAFIRDADSAFLM